MRGQGHSGHRRCTKTHRPGIGIGGPGLEVGDKDGCLPGEDASTQPLPQVGLGDKRTQGHLGRPLAADGGQAQAALCLIPQQDETRRQPQESGRGIKCRIEDSGQIQTRAGHCGQQVQRCQCRPVAVVFSLPRSAHHTASLPRTLARHRPIPRVHHAASAVLPAYHKPPDSAETPWPIATAGVPRHIPCPPWCPVSFAPFAQSESVSDWGQFSPGNGL